LISVPVFAEVALVALLPVLADVVALEVRLGRRLEVAAVAGVPETVVDALLVGLAGRNWNNPGSGIKTNEADFK
jgi:hypothetical protein